MMLFNPNDARAYVNWGKWVADCPTGCGGAEALVPRQSVMACTECKTITAIQWPSNAEEIFRELERRPMPRTRNWYPSRHPVAESMNLPSGQSVKELREEYQTHGVDSA